MRLQRYGWKHKSKQGKVIFSYQITPNFPDSRNEIYKV